MQSEMLTAAHQRPTGSAPEEFMVAIHITQPAIQSAKMGPNLEDTPINGLVLLGKF